jgi:hypothetical protein
MKPDDFLVQVDPLDVQAQLASSEEATGTACSLSAAETNSAAVNLLTELGKTTDLYN